MRELTHPIDAKFILKKKKSIKRQLLAETKQFVEKKIAVLGGSTTHDICECLELFLLEQGIKPTFYQSEYGMYYEDAMFGNEELQAFHPDVIYIHTSNRNISWYPSITDDAQTIDAQLTAQIQKFEAMWDKLHTDYACPIIQNNFEYPFYRLLGNQDASDIHGKVNYVTRLNMKMYEYAQTHTNFFIHDINYLSADFGLEKWADTFYWHMYKYALSMQAIPHLAYSISKIVKSIFGKNKKAFALDLDNTLWGGVVGDDGAAGIEIGPETSVGQVHLEFQSYLKEHKQIGVILNVVSKNDEENAIAGLNHEHSQIKPEDLISLKANWEPKSQNIVEMIEEIGLTEGSFVFVDDNPAEREIVRQNLSEVAVPELLTADTYIKTIDRSGFFEVTTLSSDDLKRNEMYKDNVRRQTIQKSFVNYADYLLSLEMKAEIKPFEPLCFSRITQLTNKSNQFNLTTKRFTQEEIAQAAAEETKITLYGKLADKFGDNGIISVLAGDIVEDVLHIDLWLMSCRVLKRDMEYAMMDELVAICAAKKITKIVGYYYKTSKNNMVADFYAKQGFTLVTQEGDDTTWSFDISNAYENKNKVIAVNAG